MGRNYMSILYYVLILLITIVTVFDLFANKGRSANMDGLTHTTTIGMFYDNLSRGQFPLAWIDGFANYGMPLPLFAHQVPNYLGAAINFITHNSVLSFNIVCFIGLFLSNILFFIFLRFYFTAPYAFLGVFVFNFAPYRILNLYIRGAIPEAFSNIFLPLILISIYFLIKKKNIYGFYTLIISITMLALAHPMTLVTFSFVFLPYLIYLIVFDEKGFDLRALLSRNNLKVYVLGLIGIIVGIGIAGYYIIPLNLEIKYFYYGDKTNHLTEGQYLSLKNYIDPNWYYFTEKEIFPRGHVISAGFVETIGVLFGVVYMLFQKIYRKEKKWNILDFSVITSVFVIFFTTQLSDFFYRNITILSNIQFPWRMLSGYMFLPPIIFAYMFSKINRLLIAVIFIMGISMLRFPQLYGKNYAYYPESFYYFTKYNLHSTSMNTKWTGRTEDYPVQTKKYRIVEGDGNFTKAIVNPSSRKYTIQANTPLKLVDYTFYFPGWTLYIDDKEEFIQYQDPLYRGVITYTVPPGIHTVFLNYEDTKVRTIGRIISILFMTLAVVLFMCRKWISKLTFNKNI